MSLCVGVPGRCSEDTGTGTEVSVRPLFADCITPIYVHGRTTYKSKLRMINVYIHVQVYGKSAYFNSLSYTMILHSKYTCIRRYVQL